MSQILLLVLLFVVLGVSLSLGLSFSLSLILSLTTVQYSTVCLQVRGGPRRAPVEVAAEEQVARPERRFGIPSGVLQQKAGYDWYAPSVGEPRPALAPQDPVRGGARGFEPRQKSCG